MTKDEIKAKVCELFEFGEDKWFDYEQEFIALVEAVSAAEREACAKVCEQQLGFIAECPEMATYCADAIRMRSNLA